MLQKDRKKIKRTKSTKRYKTITEGIAPRDLEIARQAIEAAAQQDTINNALTSSGGGGGGSSDDDATTRNVIDQDQLAQITAALTSSQGDKRKSFIVESRPASRYHSNEVPLYKIT